MIELGLVLIIIVLLLAAGAALWRRLAGPPRGGWRRGGRVLALCIVVFPLVGQGTLSLMNSRSFQLFGEMLQRVETSERVVALTFDDGPEAGYTDELLAILEQRGARATFFVTGGSIERHMAEAQRIVAAGHELGNHTFSHARMVFRSPSFIRDEIERTDALIRQAGYQGPIHFRAPNCKKLVLLPHYLAQTGRKHIIWDLEPETFVDAAAGPQAIVEHVRAGVRPGSIILLHVMYESRRSSMAAVPLLIDALQAQGYRFVTVSELLSLAP